MLYISLRDAYERLYSYEAEHHEENKPQRGYLNTYYDEFVLRYGHLNAKQNRRQAERRGQARLDYPEARRRKAKPT